MLENAKNGNDDFNMEDDGDNLLLNESNVGGKQVDIIHNGETIAEQLGKVQTTNPNILMK